MSSRSLRARKIKEQFVPILYSLINSPLYPMLGPYGIYIYVILHSKNNGDPVHDKALSVTTEEMRKYNVSSATYSKVKLALWAFNLIEITEWGRKIRQPTKYKMSFKWRTLVHFPKKMRRINELLERYERVKRFNPKNNPEKRTKEELKNKKYELYMRIKRKIMSIPI